VEFIPNSKNKGRLGKKKARILPVLQEKMGRQGEKSILPELQINGGEREEKRGIHPELSENVGGQGEKH
jgi:hypothetical protein